MRQIKVTRRAREDFRFFSRTDLDMIGATVGIIDPRTDANGYNALQCWFAHDTHGQTLPCREIDLLHKVERAKASWNLQIKLWAEDLADCLLSRDELESYCTNLPAWIFDATINQAAKLCRQKVGFVPQFVGEIKC